MIIRSSLMAVPDLSFFGREAQEQELLRNIAIYGINYYGTIWQVSELPNWQATRVAHVVIALDLKIILIARKLLVLKE